MATTLFHVNPATGDAGPCRAEKGKCPFGGDDKHYFTREAAQDSWAEIEAKKSSAVKTWRKKAPAPTPAPTPAPAPSPSYGGHGSARYGGHGR